MIKKITVFQCTECKRKIEMELDERRPYPLRCAITHKCSGIYKKIEEKNNRSSLTPPTVFGLQDYIPRGTPLNLKYKTKKEPLISVLSGNRQLMLAATSHKIIENNQGTYDSWAVESDYGGIADAYVVDDPIFLFENDIYNPTINTNQTHPIINNTILLELYELPIASTLYTEYYYFRKNSLTQISGQDNSAQQSVLRFNGGDNRTDPNKDNITVTVNGVEIPRIGSTEASLTGTYFMSIISDSGEHAIKFVPALSETNNAIKIYVYQRPKLFSDPERIKTLVFHSLPDNNQERTLNSWGDVAQIDINYQLSPNGKVDRFLYLCSNFETTNNSSELEINNQYIVKSVKAIKSNGRTVILDPTDIHLLIGQTPFSYYDKVKNLTLNLKNAIDQSNSVILQYYTDEFGNDNLFTEQNKLTNLIQNINITKNINTAFIPSGGESKVNQSNTIISSKYIVGYT